ncbi:hypothetical protein CO614_05380 [Lysobacteraceae bacterium NML120232]|nr:hypothetical protein CO608_10085 [Xanthomonadaceae bacterium NML08-0793]PJK12447.1 hypothetical protein CO614_05380 [Xanthomonadaceae bacterium NML120232]
MTGLFNNNGIWEIDDRIILDAGNFTKALATLGKKFKAATKLGIGAESSPKGGHCLSLDFLKAFPRLTHFELSCNLASDANVSALYVLPDLQFLQWWSDSPLDISQLSRLERLSCFGETLPEAGSSTLRQLHIGGAKDLRFLQKLPALQNLELRDFSGSTLAGIVEAKQLRSITIKSSKRLDCIKALQQCPVLESLELEAIGKDVELSILASCKGLKELYLHIPIASCSFLRGMENLSTLVCKEVLDNDLAPIFESKTLRYVHLYKHKKAYNYSKQELQERFAGD